MKTFEKLLGHYSVETFFLFCEPLLLNEFKLKTQNHVPIKNLIVFIVFHLHVTKNNVTTADISYQTDLSQIRNYKVLKLATGYGWKRT